MNIDTNETKALVENHQAGVNRVWGAVVADLIGMHDALAAENAKFREALRLEPQDRETGTLWHLPKLDHDLIVPRSKA